MDDVIERAVSRVIEAMHENLGEHITIDDMARTAMFSKFHFSRVFQRVTGVSPGRFLSAMRIQEAKRLLIATDLSVTDISHRVGYASVGTFSSRFSSSVGISPSAYRRLGGFTPRSCVDNRRHATGAQTTTICGQAVAPQAGRSGLIFVGLFRDRVPRGHPVRCTVLAGPGPYVLQDVPQGSWHLLVYSVADHHDELIPSPRDHRSGSAGLFVGWHGPITICSDTRVRPADVRLRPMSQLDPPVLLALLDARTLQTAST